MLDQSQKRHLGITLGVIEDELKRLRNRLKKAEQYALFTHIEDDLTEKEKAFVCERIEALIKSMAHLKELFELRDTTMDLSLRGIVKAAAVYLHVEVESMKSHNLKGYGEVNPKLKETLDPKLDGMIAALVGIESSL